MGDMTGGPSNMHVNSLFLRFKLIENYEISGHDAQYLKR